MFPRVTFILGGAASGKSAWAEDFIQTFKKTNVYLATSQLLDREMREKAAVHRERRGTDWLLEEAPLDLGPVLDGLTVGQACLVDCATMWLSNHLLANSDLDRERDRLLAAIDRCAAPVVIVSNEVGQGIVPGDALSRRFREAQGRLNIALASRADLVVQVTAGLPLVLKGQLP